MPDTGIIRVLKRGYSRRVIKPYEEMYLTGLSGDKIAALLQVRSQEVYDSLREIGVLRRRHGVYKDERSYEASMRLRARNIWKKINGHIPRGYDIHHKDHDFSNNTLENLELKDQYKHRLDHGESHRDSKGRYS